MCYHVPFVSIATGEKILELWEKKQTQNRVRSKWNLWWIFFYREFPSFPPHIFSDVSCLELTLSYSLGKDDTEIVIQALKRSQKSINVRPDLRTKFLLRSTSAVPLLLFCIRKLQMWSQCGRSSSAGKACKALQYKPKRRISLSVQLFLLLDAMWQNKWIKVQRTSHFWALPAP